MLKRLITITLLLIIISSQAFIAAPEKSSPGQPVIISAAQRSDFEIKSPAAILVDIERNQVLYAKNPDVIQHVSAACKMMTTAIVIEKQKDNLNAKVTISKESVDAEGSALSLGVGDKYTVEELLHGVMLTSANDAAKALAEFTGGDISKFVSLMNNKAAELGMNNTHFTNPTGLYDENQYTTARDLAVLMSYSLSHIDEFNYFFSTQIKSWYKKDGNILLLKSQNKLFWSYSGVDGGKTGYNVKEQISAITTATRNNRRLLCIVLNSPEDIMYEDTVKLLDYGFNDFISSLLIQKDVPQKSVMAANTEVDLVSNKNIYYTHPVGESYIKEIQYNVPETLKLPVLSTKPVGSVKYVLNDGTVITADLFPIKDIVPPEDLRKSIIKKFTDNKDILILIGFLCLVEVIIILYHIGRLIVRAIKRISVRGHK